MALHPIYTQLQDAFMKMISEAHLEGEPLSIAIKTLTPEESIGSPTRRDFPLLQGKEAMVGATFKGAKGQAFTSAQATFKGSIEEIGTLPLENDYNKALFISTLNSLMRYLGLIDRTVHCTNEEPEACAATMARTINSIAPSKWVVLVGYQPAILEALAHKGVPLSVLDLNPEHVGQRRYGVLVQHGFQDFDAVIAQGEVFLVTGSTLANGTISTYLNLTKPVYFYGNTIAGAAHILGLQRLCFKAT